MRAFIAVTHLLGAGHLTRAAALARAFAAAGHPTTLVSGGMPSSLIAHEGIEFVQLPPVKTIGTDFTTLLDEHDRPIDAARLTERRRRLLDACEAASPDLVITELFPFGRRILASEFLALLEKTRAAARRPVIACSIRDILVAPARPERVAEAHARLAGFYDAVLVHGDPALAPLEASWPVDDGVRRLLHYTGYVDEGPAVASDGPRAGIVVSGGSSPASLPLYRAAARAAALLPGHEWRILMGRGIAERDVDAVRAMAPASAVIERARPDFRALLSGARVSVSQAGYNTVVDLLRTGPFPILVPFEGGHETEQRLRAERLVSLGLAGIVTEAELSAERLAHAVRHGLERQGATAPLPGLPDRLAGARRTVAIAESLVRAAPALHAALDWHAADEALTRARDRGHTPEFWWRDDDAVAHTPALDRLLALAARHRVGIALAAIPAMIEASLSDALADAAQVDVLVHGLAHANHAPVDARKAEFGGDRPIDRLVADARQGLELARARLPRCPAGTSQDLAARLLPVFVPPWNRIAPELVARLADLGFSGLSTFRDRAGAEAAPGLVLVNTHLDPIDWHGSRGLDDPARVIANLARGILARAGAPAEETEPIGLLTHHRVHDDAVWTFCERLLDWTSRNRIRFRPAHDLFARKTDRAAGNMRYGHEDPRPEAEATES